MPVCPENNEECNPTECHTWTSRETIRPACLLHCCAEALHEVKALLDKIVVNAEDLLKPAE